MLQVTQKTWIRSILATVGLTAISPITVYPLFVLQVLLFSGTGSIEGASGGAGLFYSAYLLTYFGIASMSGSVWLAAILLIVLNGLQLLLWSKLLAGTATRIVVALISSGLVFLIVNFLGRYIGFWGAGTY